MFVVHIYLGGWGVVARMLEHQIRLDPKSQLLSLVKKKTNKNNFKKNLF